MIIINILFVLFLICAAWSLEEGQSCVKENGTPGICTIFKNCQSAIDDIQNQPQLCTFVGFTPVVCCVINSSLAHTTPPPTERLQDATTQKTNITAKPSEPEDIFTHYEGLENFCDPVPLQHPINRTGNKSWNKCIEYHRNYVSRLVVDPVLTVGGKNVEVGELPHMALVGYGKISDNFWLCGGSLISDQFVLTAGHCLTYGKLKVSNVALGIQKRSELDNRNIYKVQELIRHPEYNPPIKYHDIALLKTEKKIKLNLLVVPACLPAPLSGSGEDNIALASGWGTVEHRGTEPADILQKVSLNKFPREECAAKFPKNRLMPQGFDANTQICYGDKMKPKDTCQGDSGGPLQIRNKLLHCMYSVIGVTSFGKACGFVGDPGIYTRVEHYLPWIEPIVWG